MYITKKTLEKIKEMEGCRLQAYEDAAGVWTIGYGHTYKVRPGDRISQYWADSLLAADINVVERQLIALDEAEARRWTQGQLDAVVSFCFNIGMHRWRTSTLRKCILRHATEAEIRHEWMRWVYAGGKRLGGLVKRRAWEVNRYFEPSESWYEITK